MADYHVQTVVVGAGVVGLACAARLAADGRDVLVLEQTSAIGQGVSSRNSEVIHAGIYYPPGSVRARHCVAGRRLLYQRCKRQGIGANAIGKLIVATDESEIETLHQLQQRAQQNGVENLSLIDANAAMAMQPGLHCTAALHSAETGIVDSHQLMLSLLAEIEANQGVLALNSSVRSIQCEKVTTLQVRSNEDHLSLSCDELVNSSGLNAVALAHQVTGLETSHIPHAQFVKGNYFRLQSRAPFDMLVYPAPVKGGLGVHLTLDLAGQARFGPDVEFLPPTTNGVADAAFDYQVDPQRAEFFYAAIRKYWPALPDNSLLPDYAGMRPKIERRDGSTVDFEISGPEQHGISGLVNLFGIESPGLTSCLAIADTVLRIMNEQN